MVKKKKIPVNPKGRPKTPVRIRLSKICFNFESFSEIVKTGATDHQIAKILRISDRTLNMWKQDYEFQTILRESKEIPDEQIECSTFKRALGYDYFEEDWELVKDPGNKKKLKLMVSKRKIKHQPGDVAAQIFWLSNRKPKVWKRSISEQGGSDKPPAVFVMPVFNNALLISDEQQKEIKKLTDPKSADVKFKEIPKLKINTNALGKKNER